MRLSVLIIGRQDSPRAQESPAKKKSSLFSLIASNSLTTLRRNLLSQAALATALKAKKSKKISSFKLLVFLSITKFKIELQFLSVQFYGIKYFYSLLTAILPACHGQSSPPARLSFGPHPSLLQPSLLSPDPAVSQPEWQLARAMWRA